MAPIQIYLFLPRTWQKARPSTDQNLGPTLVPITPTLSQTTVPHLITPNTNPSSCLPHQSAIFFLHYSFLAKAKGFRAESNGARHDKCL